jgi:hypothetical protein
LGQIGEATLAQQLVEGSRGPPCGIRINPAQPKQRSWHE